MKPLSTIRQDAEFETLDLIREMEAIHPKLNKTLTHDDFNDPSLFDDSLKTKYLEFTNKVNKANEKIWKEAVEYFNAVIHDLMDAGVDVGYHSDGTEVYKNLQIVLFEPSIHTSKLYAVIYEFKHYVKFIPFWEKTCTVLNKETSQWVNINRALKPTEYIKHGLSALQDKSLSSTEQLIIAVKTELNCGYKMHSTKYKLNSLQDKDIKSYIDNVHEHKLLEELLTREPGSYNVRLYNYREDGIVVHLKEDKDVN